MMSIPRDLLVDDPGPRHRTRSTPRTRSAASAADGPHGQEAASRPTASRSRSTTWSTSTSAASGARSTTSAASTSTSTATTSTTTAARASYAAIDIDPGYQKLMGKDALDYVRYRHGDNDLVRAARQQDFLRQVRNADGRRSELLERRHRRNPKLARVFGRYFDGDKSLRLEARRSSRSPRPSCSRRSNPVREVRFRVVDAPRPQSTSTASPDMLRKTRRRVHEREGVGDAARGDRSRRPPTSRRRSSARSSATQQAGRRHRARGGARPRARTRRSSAARKVDFPFYFPTLRTTSGSRYRAPSRASTRSATSSGKKHKAYRLVLRQGRRRRVLRRPGHDLARPADPRRPARRRSCATAAS